MFQRKDELRVSEALNLCVMVQAQHQNRRDEKINEGLPDAAKELEAAIRAGFPAPVNPNPFIYFVRSDVHTLI
jgi:hypothetical protein